MIHQLSDNKFKQEVLDSKNMIIVYFWAPWCKSCSKVVPVLEEFAKEYSGKLKIYKINVEKNKVVATNYQVLSLPTMLFFKKGKVVRQMVGDKIVPHLKEPLH